MSHAYSHLVFGLAALSAAMGAGCAKQSTSDIAISSSAVSFTGSSARVASELPGAEFLSMPGIGSANEQLQDLTHLSFCVKRVRLEGEDDEAVVKDDDDQESEESGYIQFTPGLITITGGAAVNWGTANLPVDFKLKRIKVKVQKSSQNCSGAEYSVKVGLGGNDILHTEDIEFRWRFNPALELDSATGAIELSLDSIVTALRNAAVTDASHIKQAIENTEGSGKKK